MSMKWLNELDAIFKFSTAKTLVANFRVCERVACEKMCNRTQRAQELQTLMLAVTV